ncbi:hypothetical protein [Serratia ureilytica]|uniref:hypothetical protein n=1 Tax=Serratia ureilytica TaxID=300181 RepID=UPI0025758AAE|nr:hypothetical protein [Serratia ureilytica]MDM1841080.1 hypothetical protein [Serratia ureilytica]
MDNKLSELSELSKPVAWRFKNAEGGDRVSLERKANIYGRHDFQPLYSQEYVSALLAEIGEKERSLISNCVDYEYDLIEMKRRAEAAEQRVAELEAKLATPVQLQNCDFESVAIMAHWCTDEQLKAWVKGVEHAKKQIRAAGFKVEGDE